MDLYSVGEMLVDFLPGSEPGSYIRNAGGAPANVAIAAARNGLEAAMCCSVGDDDFGRYLLGTLRENRVRCIRREPCREAVTTMAFVSLTEEGERSFTFVRKPGADMFLREEDVREADIRDTVIVHAGSCSLSASPAAEATAKALHLGREMGRLVSFDVNYRDMMWNGSQEACAAKVREILPDVDLLIRPSGELRISNFLIWQSAYAEFYFTDVLWPDFSEKELEAALIDYAGRSRRFGGV